MNWDENWKCSPNINNTYVQIRQKYQQIIHFRLRKRFWKYLYLCIYFIKCSILVDIKTWNHKITLLVYFINDVMNILKIVRQKFILLVSSKFPIPVYYTCFFKIILLVKIYYLFLNTHHQYFVPPESEK